MYKRNINKSFWIYLHQNKIELRRQQVNSFSHQLICNCHHHKSALRIAKQIANNRKLGFQEVFSC